MAIPVESLERTLVSQVLDPAATVAELLHLLAAHPEPARSYVVVRFAANAYDVVALDDLQEYSKRLGAALLSMELRAVRGLLQPGKPVIQSQIGTPGAQREQNKRHRRRLVVLDDEGDVIGLLVAHFLTSSSKDSLLALITNEAAILDYGESAPLPTPPMLNTRFDGVGSNELLIVGRRVPLIISVGAPVATNSAQSSRPFAFDFAGVNNPVQFTVRVEADPEMWIIRTNEPTLILAPPGVTQQEAEFIVMARQPGRDKLTITIEREGALVQKIWLSVVAAPAATLHQVAAVAVQRVEAVLPLDTAGLLRPTVELTVQPGLGSTVMLVQADLPGSSDMIRDFYRIPVRGQTIQNATLRLRQELQKIVFYPNGPKGPGPFPFANKDTNTIDTDMARHACAPLADAGRLVWDMLFNAPGGDVRLKVLAEDIRALPHGCRLRVVLDNHEFIVPWALLYDAPGKISAATLDWNGFWGYRYQIEVFPPGRYPSPAIGDVPPNILMLLNDDQSLSQFTRTQVQYVQQTLVGATTEVVWGSANVQQTLQTPPAATLVYCYCHGEHKSGAASDPKRDVTSLASESALLFGGSQRMRIADLRQLPAGMFSGRPLVFLNACEGAAQDAFYYDGFMPFFIQQQGARGFIGAEVKAPQLLAHELALQFLQMFSEGQAVGEILWQLRRHYIDQHNNILAFNYSLYCPGETRLVNPLLRVNELQS
jgi:hypothetical protein